MFLEFAFNGTPVIFSPSAVPLLQEMIYTSSFSAFFDWLSLPIWNWSSADAISLEDK